MSRRDPHEISTAGEHMLKNVRGFLDGAEELLRATAHYSGENLAAARARMTEQVDQMREVVGDAGLYARDRARQAATATDQYVHRNPWQAIGIAAATGVLVGWLTSRRS
jgi:ElaB/YqjD/DUF883 family membrane-anchored ribosome-binding protein